MNRLSTVRMTVFLPSNWNCVRSLCGLGMFRTGILPFVCMNLGMRELPLRTCAC